MLAGLAARTRRRRSWRGAVHALGPAARWWSPAATASEATDVFFDGERARRDPGRAPSRRRRPRLGLHALLGARGAPRARARAAGGGAAGEGGGGGGRARRPARHRRGRRARGRARRPRSDGAASATGSGLWHNRRSSRAVRRIEELAIKFLRMKPGHGEVLLTEGDPRVREDEERLVEEFRRQLDEGMWAAVPVEDAGQRAARGADGARLRRHPARGRARDLLPARLRRLSRRRCCSRCSSSRSWRPCWPRPLGRAQLARRRGRAARRRRRDAAGGADRLRPGRERRAEQRARQLLRSCVNDEEWAMYRDLGFIRVAGPPPAARSPRGRRRRPPYAYLVYPHKPIVAYVPETRAAAERVLRRVPGPHRRRHRLAAARLRRRAGQVDGADLRREPRDRPGQHAPGRAASSTRRGCGATCGACRSGSAAAAAGPSRLAGA